MYINCKYYLSEGKCLIGECYISRMPTETPKEIINEHIRDCISKKTVTTLLKNGFGELEKRLDKNF